MAVATILCTITAKLDETINKVVTEHITQSKLLDCIIETETIETQCQRKQHNNWNTTIVDVPEKKPHLNC